MQLTTVFSHVGRNDLKVIGRDSLLVMLMGYGFVIAVVIRFAVPAITESLMNTMEFDLTPYYPLLLSGMILHQAAALLGGTVMGFVLLDERDNGTLNAMMVTPIPVRDYVLYRVIVPMLMGFFLGFAGLIIVAELSQLTVWQMLIIAAVNSLLASLISLLLATFSANKVEGFATIKIIGSLSLIVMGAWFVPEPWQFLAGIYPAYWTMKSMWMAEAGSSLWGLYLPLALLTQIGALVLLVRRFTNIVYEG